MSGLLRGNFILLVRLGIQPINSFVGECCAAQTIFPKTFIWEIQSTEIRTLVHQDLYIKQFIYFSIDILIYQLIY